MRKLLERIKAGEALVADGACGTMFMERGLSPRQAPGAIWARREGLTVVFANLKKLVDY